MKSTHGFSLVELSIVLVILGLLTGGILSGQSLIRAAELRSVSTELAQYHAAIKTFQDKYFAIPGDFKDATKFWGKDNAACTGDTGTAATPGTCNGNGDGNIAAAASAGATGERHQFWKQLALAGLIEGSYSGLSGSTTHHVSAAVNAPKSKIGNGAWGLHSSFTGGGDTEQYAVVYNNYFILGAATTNNLPYAPLLKPEEAWNIDTKVDDGRPAYGKIIARFWNNLCAAADDGTHANNDLNASYKLSDSAIRCALYFRDII